jgi:hypothetical protein
MRSRRSFGSSDQSASAMDDDDREVFGRLKVKSIGRALLSETVFFFRKMWVTS